MHIRRTRSPKLLIQFQFAVKFLDFRETARNLEKVTAENHPISPTRCSHSTPSNNNSVCAGVTRNKQSLVEIDVFIQLAQNICTYIHPTGWFRGKHVSGVTQTGQHTPPAYLDVTKANFPRRYERNQLKIMFSKVALHISSFSRSGFIRVQL